MRLGHSLHATARLVLAAPHYSLANNRQTWTPQLAPSPANMTIVRMCTRVLKENPCRGIASTSLLVVSLHAVHSGVGPHWQVLLRRTKNNPVLVGDPGVGKTAVAEGIAQLIGGPQPLPG